jgi:hypothetical protein
VKKLIYEQSIHWTKTNYVKDRFWYELKWMSGKREEDNHEIKLKTGRNLFDKIELTINNKRMNELKSYFDLIKKDVKKAGLDFDAIIYLHNEIVLINKEKRDNRSFGFIRLIIKKEGTTICTEDIPICTETLLSLEDVVKCSIMNCCKKYHHIGIRGEKRRFKKMPHVLSAKAAGFFIHEIIGHLLEADYYSYFKDRYKGMKIAPHLTVIDSAKDVENVAGIGEYDDVGNKMKSITLIQNGVINNVMSVDKHNSFDNEVYGFARRSSFKDPIMPRMRNTYIQPCQDMYKQDILNQYKEAVLIEETNLGVVDYYSGEFKLYGNGFIVREGILQNFLGELCVYGNIKRDISMIEYIGKDFKLYGGYCGKMGQSVHVGFGGPTISLLEMTSEGVIYG